MTELLEQAFQKAAKLPRSEQDRLANWLLEELASERQWEQTLLERPDRLVELADEALAEHRRGETQSLDPEVL